MDNVTTIVVAIIGSGILTTILNRIFAIRDRKADRDTAVKAGLRELLYDTIKTRCVEFESAGEVNESDYNSIKRMWAVYHNQLGGNGFLDGHMKQVDALPKVI